VGAGHDPFRCYFLRVSDHQPAVAPDGFPAGASITVEELSADPHPLLRRLREAEPVSWLPAVGGWLVTRADLVERVLLDPDTFTVDDPRFSTARVVGPSMLSLDGPEHRRHRDPFARALRESGVRTKTAARAADHSRRLVGRLAARGAEAELRRELAGPLAVSVMADLLGLEVSPEQLLAWYDAIVAGVNALSVAETGQAARPVPEAASAAFGELSAQVEAALATGADSVLASAPELTPAQVVSNAAVLMFGGIETTEGMIGNAAWYLLQDPQALHEVMADRSRLEPAIEEALRLEPAAAVVDRYARADTALAGAEIRRGDLVRVSLAGANRDPAVFADPDRFDITRPNVRRHLAFAVGPHFCIGAALARAEASAAIGAALDLLPGLRLDPAHPSRPQGLVFRKPPDLRVRWNGQPVSEATR
jgi:cytochrome P450